MDEQKFQHIESALAHQDRQILDLSDMVNRQWREIELLRRQLDQALAKMKEMNAAVNDTSPTMSVSEAAALEKPPHY